ncbi:MAG: hypothetical protein IAE89_08155 [Anaerolineae bacterium]|nr:hypothetical protein [Anaerolineae bacterium]
MAFDFEALVGHLNVVNGRAVSSTPPGALVEVAPRKAARGREADTFFGLVLPSGDSIAPAAFYEQMVTLCAERYFNSAGSVTNGLRAAFAHLNENLFDHNQRDPHHYEATILCGVLRGSDLYVARIGAGVALFWQDDAVQPFPIDFSNDEQLYGTPLGVQMSPDMRMAMYTVKNGTRLLLADAALADLDYHAVCGAMGRDDIGEMLIGLKELAAVTLTALAVEFVPPEVASSAAAREGESTRGETAGAVSEKTSTGKPQSIAGGPRLSDTRGDSVKRAAGGAALATAAVVDGVNSAVDKVLPEPKDSPKTRTSPWMAALALLIPVVVVVAVIMFWVSGTGQSVFDKCVADAYQAANLARGIASNDVRGTVAAWGATQAVIESCETMKAGDPQLAALRQEAQQVTDALVGIDRRQTTVVDALPSAVLTRAVLQGEDLYVLDDGNDIVYRLTLNPNGLSVASGTRQAINAMRRGGTVNQFAVSDILDIAWADDDAGLQQGSVITALDSNGVLINCPPRFTQQCSAQRLNTSTWVSPISMQFWQGRLYVLDPDSNQIWRYDPSGGAYPNAPQEYFVGEGRPDIRQAVDFAIDTPGSIYVLLNDGSLLKYTSGQRVGFAFSNFPEGQPLSGVESLFLNTDPTDQMMYIVAGGVNTIYQTTHAGTRASSFRSLDDSQFDALTDVAVNSNKDLVYALSGTTIFAFERQQ